ncbi:MAG: hypothetical protein Q8N98_00385 [bacterium]|nr:hypothetical protein [bacterium]
MAPIESDLVATYIGKASRFYRQPRWRQEAINPEDISRRAREGTERIDRLVGQIFDGWSQKTSPTAPRYIAELAVATRNWLAESGESNVLGLVRIVWQIGMQREDYWVPCLLLSDVGDHICEEVVLGRQGDVYRATNLPTRGIINRELTTWKELDSSSALPLRRALSIADEEIFVEPVGLGETRFPKCQIPGIAITATGLRHFIEFGNSEHLFREEMFKKRLSARDRGYWLGMENNKRHARPCFVDTEITKVLGEMAALYYPRETLWGVASLDPKSVRKGNGEIGFDGGKRWRFATDKGIGPQLALRAQQSLISLLAEAEAGLKTMYGQFLSP